jgi:hypothetical protein
MADELPGAIGNRLQQCIERGAVEVASRGDADGTASGEDSVRRDRWKCFEAAAAGPEGADEEAAACASAERCGPAWLEGIADAADAGLLERTDDWAGDARQQVGVFVRVDVGKREASALELLDLREGLALNVVLADGAAKNAQCEVAERAAEGAAILIFFRAEQCGDGGRIGHGRSVDEHDVTANAEGGPCECQCDGVVEGGTGGHQGCRHYGTGIVEFGDGTVDAGRETEVVRVDDEARLHRDETRADDCR